MPTTLELERSYYDRVYARHLERPDHELVVSRRIMMSTLNDPSQPAWERRRLHLRVWMEMMAEPLSGARVLDYGCGPGDWGVLLATEGARVTLLDLSPVAIELGLRRAAASGVRDRVDGVARDGSDLSCFPSGEFDLVVGSAAVHHTLKYGPAVDELVRVIRPGGRLLLAETLGNNPLLNAARRVLARVSGEDSDQGEGIIFGDAEIAMLRERFGSVELTPMHLLAMSKRLFRGRFEQPRVRRFLRTLERADRAALRRFPSLGRYCGEAVILCTNQPQTSRA